MPAPTVAHKGFFVPNAQDVTLPELAEPDRIDFNIAGNARWGVLNGCVVTVSAGMATNTPGTVLVNGVLVDVVGGQDTNVGAGGSQDRFDIVGVDTTGKLVTVAGTPSLDPVFPDVPLDTTALAAVLCTAGGGDYSSNVVDKRNMLADSLKTKLAPGASFLQNKNGTGNLFHVDGAGKTTWQTDVTIERVSDGEGINAWVGLKVTPNLQVTNDIIAGRAITAAGHISATGRVGGSNLRNGAGIPSDASGSSGDIFTHSATGKGYLHQDGKWEEIATVKSVMPTGSVITSLQPPSYMTNLGWVLLDGSTVTEAEAPTLFTIPALMQYITTPPSGPRTMALPDARRRVALFSPDDVGRTGGQTSFTLLTQHMPVHKHGVRVLNGGGYKPEVTIGRDGQHRHAVRGGAHGHPINDPGHAHNGADHITGGGFVCAAWGGQNKIDALFNDRSHTYSVDVALWTKRAYTGISIGSAGSEHSHELDEAGDHDHTATISATPAHPHNVLEDPAGGGIPMPFTPAYLSVYLYVRK